MTPYEAFVAYQALHAQLVELRAQGGSEAGEDALFDQMDTVWWRLSPEDRHALNGYQRETLMPDSQGGFVDCRFHGRFYTILGFRGVQSSGPLVPLMGCPSCASEDLGLQDPSASGQANQQTTPEAGGHTEPAAPLPLDRPPGGSNN